MNAKPTPGPWKFGTCAGQVEGPNGEGIGGEIDFSIPDKVKQANAGLIVAAVNACFAINPENPTAVAEALPELVNELKQIMNRSRDFEFVVPRPIAEKIRAALTKAEAKS